MKRFLLLTILILAIGGVAKAQVQSDFTLTISRLGATQNEADAALLAALGAFARSLPGDSDIYQRNVDGSIVIDNNGLPTFDKKKVEARLTAFFSDAVDAADVSFRAEPRKADAVAQIEQEEQDAIKQRKPISVGNPKGVIIPLRAPSRRLRPVRRKP